LSLFLEVTGSGSRDVRGFAGPRASRGLLPHVIQGVAASRYIIMNVQIIKIPWDVSKKISLTMYTIELEKKLGLMCESFRILFSQTSVGIKFTQVPSDLKHPGFKFEYNMLQFIIVIMIIIDATVPFLDPTAIIISLFRFTCSRHKY
jgi:hypothetical protein